MGTDADRSTVGLNVRVSPEHDAIPYMEFAFRNINPTEPADRDTLAVADGV